MLETERRKENVLISRPNIKFKTIRNECLPFLSYSPPHSLQGFQKFQKRQFNSCWRNTALIRKQLNELKQQQRLSKDNELHEIKRQLKNQSRALLMKKKHLEKRLQANTLIRVAMKEISNKQEQLLNSDSCNLEIA